ncbi:hypothetical protein D3C74_412250 [compost metagenome]
MCSRIGAYAPRSPGDKSEQQIQETHPFTQPQSRPAEIVLVARLVQLRVNGRREHGYVICHRLIEEAGKIEELYNTKRFKRT